MGLVHAATVVEVFLGLPLVSCGARGLPPVSDLPELVYLLLHSLNGIEALNLPHTGT